MKKITSFHKRSPLKEACKRVLSFSIAFLVLACSGVTQAAPVILQADANDDLAVKPLIESKFGPETVEDQVWNGCKRDDAHTSGPHIFETHDAILKKDVFEFLIHADLDVDCMLTKTDRQRLEIKTFDGSPEYLKARPGETHEYRWLMYLPPDFAASHGYTHLFQIKAVGGEDHRMPVLTLTPVFDDDGSRTMQVRYSPGGKTFTKLVFMDIDAFLGQWVEIWVRATQSPEGPLLMDIRNLSGKTIWTYNGALNLTRNQFEFSRPKWGIYRSLQHIDQLKNERIRFADFCIAKGSDACPRL